MQPADPEEFARNMLRVMEDGTKFYTSLLQRTEPQGKSGAAAPEFLDASKTLAELSQAWMADPGKLAEAQGQLYQNYLDLWNGTMRRLMGEAVPPVAKPDPGDSRFKDAEWSANPYFDYWKQAYLISTKWAEQMLVQTPGLDEKVRCSRLV
jgi:polyhydroxyalkanoate synthase subunit PhaC